MWVYVCHWLHCALNLFRVVRFRKRVCVCAWSMGFPEIRLALAFLDFDGRLRRQPFHRPPVFLLILLRPKREEIAESPRSMGSPKDRAKQQRRATTLQTVYVRKEFKRHPIRRNGVQKPHHASQANEPYTHVYLLLLFAHKYMNFTR